MGHGVQGISTPPRNWMPTRRQPWRSLLQALATPSGLRILTRLGMARARHRNSRRRGDGTVLRCHINCGCYVRSGPGHRYAQGRTVVYSLYDNHVAIAAR